MSFCFGMPALIEIPDIESTVELCQRLGLSFIELNMNMPTNLPERLKPSLLRKISDETGIEFTMHLPEELDLASFHQSIREGHVKRTIETIEWAAEADVVLLNMHFVNGIHFTLPDRKVRMYEQYYDEYLANQKESFIKILELCNKYNIKFCVENIHNFNFPFIDKVLVELNQLDGFSLTWDVGHDAISGYKEQEILLRHKDKISHMHLHDYNVKSDHQVLFTGEVDIEKMIDFAKEQDARVLIEIKTVEALERSVDILKEKGLF